jgi:hypothetical protein
MSLLDKLKGIISISVDVSNLKDIHFFSDNTKKEIYNIDNRTININVNNISAKDIPQVQEAIRQAVNDQSDVLLEDKAKLLVEDIGREENNKNNQDLITFFQGKLPQNDVDLLRASLYVKSVYDKDLPIGDLKNNVINKYGDRGRHFVNLCTAGYFSSIFKPLYLEMEKDKEFSKEAYLKIFNKLMDQSPFAIFVYNQITPDELEKSVREKIKVNKKYGINYLNIHGIGESNINKIEKLLIKIRQELKEIPDVESSRNYIIITLYF